ncbi:MAG TPA: sulfatase [Bryobacteraceae bacterium]|nr:sulfatase [Bryobacteraceae bacterium]
MPKQKLSRRQALGAMAAPLLAAGDPRPNFLFILIDDLRFNALASTGHPFVKTPNIDRIGREGVTMTNAFVTTPLCSPSRASYLTGRYVRSHKVLGNSDNAALSHKLITWPRLLHDAGYETSYAGKWHMGMDDSPRPGFDRWVSFRGQGVYNDPPINVDGQRIQAKGYVTDILTDYTIEFLKKPRSKPFVAYLAHKAVHGPFTPAERHKDLFASEKIVRTANARDNLDGKPVMQRKIDGAPAVSPEATGSSDDLIRNQLRCLTAIDEGVGRILKTLEETRQLDNTFIVFTSDNGYFWGDHHLGDKRWAYEESIRIPMFMRYPKRIKAGSKISQIVMNVDMAPTMLELGGAKALPEMQGRSIIPLFKGSVKNWRTSFLSEYFEEPQNKRVPSWQAVRNDQWKYIHYTGLEGMDELYDLKKDSGEMKNLIHDAPGPLSSLKKDLDKYNQQIQ